MSDGSQWQVVSRTPIGAASQPPKQPAADAAESSTSDDSKWKVVSRKPVQVPGRQGPLYLQGQGHLGKLQNDLLDYADKASSEHYKTQEALARQASGGKHGYEATPAHLQWLDTLGDPATYARMGADSLGVVGGIAAHPVQTLASFFPVTRVPVLLNVGYQGLKQLDQKKGKDESGPDYIQRMLLGGSMLAGAAGGLGKGAPKDLQATKALGTKGINFAKAMPDIVDAAKRMWDRPTLVQAAHDTLRDSQVGYDKMVTGAIKQARERLGDTVSDISSADRAKNPQGYMPTAVINQVMDHVENAKNAPSSMFPSIESVRKMVNTYGEKFGGMLQWEHLKDVRSLLGSAMENASGKDLAGASALYKAITSAMRARAQQLGKLDIFDDYTNLTKSIDEGSRVWRDVTKSKTPVEFWKNVGDVAKQPLLRGTASNPGLFDTLEKYGGMQSRAIEDAVEEHGPISRLAKQGEAGMVRGGRIAAFARHPLVAIPAGLGAYYAAGVSGSLGIRFILSALAASKAADLVDQFDAARAKPGSAPGLTPYVSGQVVPPTMPGAPQGGASPQGLPPGQPGRLPSPTPGQLPQTASPANKPTPPAVATPPVQPKAPVESQVAPSNTPVEKPAVGGVVAKASPKAYEQFGVQLDPTQWKTPEDVIAGKNRAQQQLQVDAVAKGKAIQNALRQGLITKAQAHEQLTKLGEDALKARDAINKVKATEVSRGARDRLRKGAQVKQRDAEVASEEQAKERTSGISLEQAVERVADLEKGFKALGEHKEFLRVAKEFEKAGGDDYATLANELEDAYNEVLKKHSGSSPATPPTPSGK